MDSGDKKDNLHSGLPKSDIKSPSKENLEFEKRNRNHIDQNASKQPPETAEAVLRNETAQNLKTNSCSDFRKSTVFFNEKGWPVKMMRITDESIPKGSKPWPSRSLTTTTCNKTARKEKSLYTLKKSTVNKSSKENKENKNEIVVKELETTAKKEITFQSSDQKVLEENPNVEISLKSDLKSMLDQVAACLDTLPTETKPQDENDKHSSTRTTPKEVKKDQIERKTPRSETKETPVCSARSTKYNSKEMKAYIKTKRSERKMQMSEEAKKKQELLELQRKNLEKLRETASKVLKKSSSKTVEENKPRWQGPLEEDKSEESPTAIHIFESKIPTARIPKLSVKTDNIPQPVQINSDQREPIKELSGTKENQCPSVEEGDNLSEGKNKLTMEKDKSVEKGKQVSKLRRNKLPVNDPIIASALEKAVALQAPNLGKELEIASKSVDRLIQSPSSPGNWNQINLTPSHVNPSPPMSPDPKRSTFDIRHPTRDSPQHTSSFKLPSEMSQRKRPQSSSHKSPIKKLSKIETVPSSCGISIKSDLMESALKKVQDKFKLDQKEGKDQDWLQSLIKPDAFTMMNVIKMKSYISPKKDSLGKEKRERFKQRIETGRYSLEDETDAPSIVSMEEDIRILPDPLRLSDMQIPIPSTNDSVEESLQWSPQSSIVLSQTNKKHTDESLKTSSSYTVDAPPLVLPQSVRHLKLKSGRTYSDLSSLSSQKLQQSYVSDLAKPEKVFSLSSPEERKLAQPSVSSKISSKYFFEQEFLDEKTQSNHSNLRSSNDQIEIGQVKLTPLRSASVTSIVESSSSESSIVLKTYDDKKRQETDREKIIVLYRKKVEKEIIKRLHDEARKVQEIEKVERSLKSGRSRRDKSTSPLESVLEASIRDVTCSVEENNGSISQHVTSSLQSVEEAKSTDVYNSESFESPESSETTRQPKMINRSTLANKPFVAARFNNKSKVLIKVPLSPRLHFRSKRRCSSGSDESLLLSQNETQSEQSDLELKVSALKEQKRQRLAILNRLQRELKKAQKDLLKATEASLIKQIQVYDSYIDQTKKQLEEVSATKAVRPQIKHPRVSDKFLPRKSGIVERTSIIEDQPKQRESLVSDVDTNSIKSISEVSSTETTIQSVGQAQVTEQSSPKSEINATNDYKSSLDGESEITEVLSNVVTEASDVPEVQSSNEADALDNNTESPKSVVSKSTNFNDSIEEVQWVDAEEFFNQLDRPDKSVSDRSNESKVSVEENLTLTTPKTNISQNLNNVSQNNSSTSSAEPKAIDDELKTNSSDFVLPVGVLPTAEDLKNDKSCENGPSGHSSSADHSVSEKLDVGSVVSIISHAPSNKVLKSSLGSQSDVESDPNSSNINTEVFKESSDVISDNNDLSISIASSKTSKATGTASLTHSKSNESSISSDVNATSQYYSEEDENNSISNHSELNEQIESSQSDIIKVFVSNKNEENNEIGSSFEESKMKLNDTYIVSKENEVVDSLNKESVEKITDYIFKKLLSECFQYEKTHVELKPSEKHDIEPVENNCSISVSKNELVIDEFAKSVLNKFLQEATECMLRINESKKLTLANFNSGTIRTEEKSSNQLLEALALEGNGRTSTENSRKERLQLPNKSANEVEFNDGNENEVFWFDEDLHPVSLQAQREAEELRLKQLQIEQEIKQLEQAQENIPSYYYVRAIPNKPPPPYTPPGQSSTQTKSSTLDPITSRQEDIESLVSMATQSLTTVWSIGGDLTTVQPSDQFNTKVVGNQVYKTFLFDLVKRIFIDITSNDGNEKDVPPWERTGCRMKRLVLPKLTGESVSSFVLKKVRVLFGFEPDSIKENLIIQWSRKKRDRVDELLVRESQEEEQEWTDYSKCEVAVKNTVALSIFDSLLEDTTEALNDVFEKKLKYAQQNGLNTSHS